MDSSEGGSPNPDIVLQAPQPQIEQAPQPKSNLYLKVRNWLEKTKDSFKKKEEPRVLPLSQRRIDPKSAQIIGGAMKGLTLLTGHAPGEANLAAEAAAMARAPLPIVDSMAHQMIFDKGATLTKVIAKVDIADDLATGVVKTAGQPKEPGSEAKHEMEEHIYLKQSFSPPSEDKVRVTAGSSPPKDSEESGQDKAA